MRRYRPCQGPGHWLRAAPCLGTCGGLCIRNYHLDGVLACPEDPVLSVATAVQWHPRAALPCRQAKGAAGRRSSAGSRVADRPRRVDPRVAGPASIPSTVRSSSRQLVPADPTRSRGHVGVLTQLNRVFRPQPAESFRSFEKEVMCNHCPPRSPGDRLVGAGAIPHRGVPVLLEPEHIQVVRREWCPVTLAASADLPGQGQQVVRNTYRMPEPGRPRRSKRETARASRMVRSVQQHTPAMRRDRSRETAVPAASQ